MRSKSRAITFKLHGFHDNGLLGDTEFHFWFTLRFSLSVDATSFIDPWFRSLHVELIPGSVGIDIEGISGWFKSGDEYKQKIEAGFRQHADVGSFPVTTSTDPDHPLPHDQARLIIADIVTTREGGIDFLVTPEPIVPGLGGSYTTLVQQQIDAFVDNF